MVQGVTEEKFLGMIEGVDLSDQEKAVLRKAFSLPFEENLIPKHQVLEQRCLLLALDKLPE